MILKKVPELKECKTVGKLIVELQKLPKTLPVNHGLGIGIKPTVFNSKTNAFLEFEEVE